MCTHLKRGVAQHSALSSTGELHLAQHQRGSGLSGPHVRVEESKGPQDKIEFTFSAMGESVSLDYQR